MKFLSLASPEIDMLTTFSAASNKKFMNMTTFRLGDYNHSFYF